MNLDKTVHNTLQEVTYLSGVMEKKKGSPAEKVIERLQDAVTTHFRAIKGMPVGFPYFINLNPELLLRIVGELLEYAPQQVSTLQLVFPVCIYL